MRTKKRQILIALIVLAGSSMYALGIKGEIKVLQRVVSWPADQGDAPRGLHVTHLGEDRLEERLYFLGNDSRLVLSSSLSAVTGRMEQVLFDDRSGWWVRLVIDSRVTGKSLQEFFHNAYSEETALQHIILSTVDGLEVQTEAPLNDSPPIAALLSNELRRQGVTEDLSRSAPDDVAHAVVFLAGSLADVHAAVSPGIMSGRSDLPLLDLLGEIFVTSAGFTRRPPTPMVLDELHKGRDAVDEEFLGRFRTVAPGDSFG